MTESDLRRMLDEVRAGSVDADTAAGRIREALATAPFEDLGFARIDTHRHVRQGFPEVILGLGKTPAQISAVAERIVASGQSLLVTRVSKEAWDAVRLVAPEATYHEDARAITLKQGQIAAGTGTVLIACAGTSDLPVAEEAAVTADIMGNVVDRLYDVGVAGLHRLLAEGDRLQAARVLVVAAGMEGALPSVVGGLVSVPVIALPTSVGYGANFGGLAALLAMLNSCATGVAVVNIDNGFGAGALAHRINALASTPAEPVSGPAVAEPARG
jgi:pyridinium-3,5-biscarboxylic acid mononucleotide synthase